MKKKTLAAIIAGILCITAIGSAVVVVKLGLLNNDTATTQTTSITLEKAKQIALNESKSGTVVRIEKDTYLGKTVYEVTILDGQTEKEYRIDANTGEILKVNTEKVDADDDSQTLANANPQIDLEKAETLVKEKYPNATLKSIELDAENGTLGYDVTIVEGTTEIELRIDANTGAIVEQETDSAND